MHANGREWDFCFGGSCEPLSSSKEPPLQASFHGVSFLNLAGVAALPKLLKKLVFRLQIVRRKENGNTLTIVLPFFFALRRYATGSESWIIRFGFFYFFVDIVLQEVVL